MTMNPVAKEPVAVAAVTAIISWLAAKYAIKVSPEQASEIAGVVLVIAGGFARQLVTPTAKLEYKVEPPAEPATTEGWQPAVSFGTGTFPDPPDPGKPGVHP